MWSKEEEKLIEEYLKELEQEENWKKEEEYIQDELRHFLETQGNVSVVSVSNVETPEVSKTIEKDKKQDELVEKIVKRLKEETRTQEIELLTKEDIIEVFKCENDKALKIMRLAFEMRYATKIGKEFYIKKDDFDKFINEEKGRKVIL